MTAPKDTFTQFLQRVFRRRVRTAQPRGSKLRFESLEGRRLLAADGSTLAIAGTVFLDSNQSGTPNPGEVIQNATIELYLDDGDGVFEPNGNDVQVGQQLTDASGFYCFDSIDGLANYFVLQPAQSVDGIDLEESVSGLISPGAPTLLIDGFQTSQTVTASPPPISSEGNTLQFANENEVLGSERDLFVELQSGVGEVDLRVNPFGMLPVLQFDSASGVEGLSLVTWDGIDNDPNPVPSMGLGGRDLTQNGANTGFVMQLGIDQSGAGELLALTLYQGNANNFSATSALIPTTDGTASSFLYIPFSDFLGPVSPANVDAIQLAVGENAPSADGQIAFIGVTGPRLINFANAAEVTGVDLEIEKTNNTTTVVPGETVNYTITVTNNGPSDVVGATVLDLFPPELSNVSYTSVTTGTVSGNTTSGTGDILDSVDMTVGSTITYTVTATIDPGATGNLQNTTTVGPPEGVPELDPSNNTATENDTLVPAVDLAIVKSNGTSQVAPGDATSYTIVVTNNGPSDVIDAAVQDLFPSELVSVSYTSSVTNGTASGNTASGNGNINDLLDMSAGSSVTYLVTAQVDNNATGSIVNTATVTAPEGTTERNPNNNSSTDTDVITEEPDEVDLAISKTNGVNSVVPGTTVTYTIVVQNLGSIAVVDAEVEDTFPNTLTNVSYTSTTSGTVSGNTPNGTGNISDLVDMGVGSSITYVVTGTVTPGATGQLSNTATVAPPDGVVDSNPSNNTATDTDPLTPQVDLAITKTNNQTSASPGSQSTYVITVTNSGPSDVENASVEDLFPTTLTNVTYTSATTGGASGNTASGSGNIDDLVDMPVGSSIVYTVSTTVSQNATNNITNTATVAPPNGVTDTNPSNNSATDVDTLIASADLQITKTSGQTGATPGGSLVYTIVVTNNGPSPVTGAAVADSFPSSLTNVTYTSATTGTVSGNTASGSGNLNDTVNMSAGATITYTVMATVASNASGSITNTATVTAPSGVVDPNPNNNSDNDVVAIDALLARISGFVYVDLNDNGIFDPNESPIPGVEITLELNDNEVATDTTDTNGAYQFDNLVSGTYFVLEEQPAGFRTGRATVGGGIGEVVDSNTFRVPLEPGDNATQLNFGELPLQPSKRELLASSFRNRGDSPS